MRLPKLTLAQVFGLTFAAVSLVVTALLYLQLESARRSVLERSEQLREAAAARIDARIAHDLSEASNVVADVESAIDTEAIDARTPAAVEAPLFELLLEHPNVSDISLTNPDRWQLSAYRTSAGPTSDLVTRAVTPDGDHFTAETRTRKPGASVRAGVVARSDAGDPTAHLTYATTVSSANYGSAIWSDLHRSELDAALPEQQRRVVVTVQKAVNDAHGKPAGVVRVGLLAATVDDIAKTHVEEGDADDPHRVFLCDEAGRLLTRLHPDDRLTLFGDDLRIAPERVPPEITRALSSPQLRQVTPDRPIASEAFQAGGRTFLLTLRLLEGTQGWIAAIVVPEEHYTRDLRALRDRFIVVDAIGALAALLGGALVLASIRGGFRKLLTTSSRMRDFDFAPDPEPSALRDVDTVVKELERAKTAMRALSKYVPVDVVRELHASNREPTLGGELANLTVMFTDLRGFTDLSEQISPNELARALGYYLEAMTEAIRATGGTIDKFIGDSVMAMWNAPTPVPDHAVRACRAALACGEATERLYASAAWKGLPPLVTRFGMHTDRVLVGHFGAPARISYTALGDGVNLASRLEGLGKQYGLTRVVSDAVEAAARSQFAFRKLDRVAVKGKSRALVVFELLGDVSVAPPPHVAAYEAALEDYFARRFEGALARLEPLVGIDPAADTLLERCRMFLSDPPPPDWDGAWFAQSK